MSYIADMIKRHDPPTEDVARNTSDTSQPRLGDHPALDFLNSISAPKGILIEQIASGRALMQWLVDVQALEQAEAELLSASWSQAQLDGIAREAIALREWFRGLLARVKNGGFANAAESDLTQLNDLLARDCTFQRIIPAGGDGPARLVSARQWHDPGMLLVPIAIAMAELLCEADFDLINRCENSVCTMWFYDRTKGHRRRWCSQAVCGNRAKVAAHRMRKKSLT